MSGESGGATGGRPIGWIGPSAERIAPYGVAIFASAFLIFLVQPMVGKRMLPWFGGVPGVWTVCLAFYQTALLFGYAYAHGLTRIARPGLQLAIHAAVVFAAFATLPVLPQSAPNLDGTSDPTRIVLGLLLNDVALPFLVLSATGPLVQHWHALARPTASPYGLYAVSNLGSFAALIAYPFVIEPRLALSLAGRVWDQGFAVVGLLVVACAIPAALAGRDAGGAGSGPESALADSGARPSFARMLYWMAAAATAVVVLMGVTNKLCLDVASVPFLWLLPLATYLATFILAFSSDRAYHRGLFGTLALAAFLATRTFSITTQIGVQAAGYCLMLFAVGMLLHGEIYHSRPTPRFLTRFYLSTSAGGAIGGLFAGIAAPALFTDYTELPTGLLATLILVLATCIRDPQSFLHGRAPAWRWAVAGPLVLAFAGYFLWLDFRPKTYLLHRERSFFGVLSVFESSDELGARRTLASGSTRHGTQLLGEGERRLPTTYYGRATGLGLVLTSRPLESRTRIGVVGLGAGTLAAYGRPGDFIRFYEIDPIVARIAGRGGYFSFIEDARAEVEVVLGDARRSIEDEQRRGALQRYDVLVLDAFSSDAIPVHLMTKEAFEGYFRALAPDGLMAVHVSNRHFDLMSLVSRIAQEFGAASLQLHSTPNEAFQSDLSDWVVIGRDPDLLTRLRIRVEKRHRAMRLPPGSLSIFRGKDLGLADMPLWTDDFSDLSRVVRWR